MAWEVEAALRKMKNGKEAGKDQVNIETLEAGDETIAKQQAKLYTKCITERRIPKTWKEANMVKFFKKGNTKDIKNYKQIGLLSNMYKLFIKIITTRLEKKLDENQPREQAGFRSKYSTTEHIHAINQLKEKCRVDYCNSLLNNIAKQDLSKGSFTIIDIYESVHSVRFWMTPSPLP